MIIETSRLILREMKEEDYDALYAILADSDIMQHYPYTFDETRVRGWITKNIERYKTFGFGLWAVCLKDTGEMIGDCGLTMQMINGKIKPEIGYHIRGDKQRKGYAKEAASAVRDWIFENTPFNVVYSYMKGTNMESCKTAISWGCRQVDEYEDDENEITKVFAITREEWNNTMTRVIFLDIDGVLNSNFWNDSHQREISDGTLVDEEKIKILAPLVKRTNAKIILHSGWRIWFDSELKPLRTEAKRLIDLFAKEGLSIDGLTPDLTTEEIRRTKKFSLVKADEILAWLKSHKMIAGWVVLDDLDLHNVQIEQHQVKPDQAVGLTLEDIEKAERILLSELSR